MSTGREEMLIAKYAVNYTVIRYIAPISDALCVEGGACDVQTLYPPRQLVGGQLLSLPAGDLPAVERVTVGC